MEMQNGILRSTYILVLSWVLLATAGAVTVQGVLQSWIDTSQGDFEKGYGRRIDTYFSPGNVRLLGNDILVNGGFDSWSGEMPESWIKVYGGGCGKEDVIVTRRTGRLNQEGCSNLACVEVDDTYPGGFAGIVQTLDADLDSLSVEFSVWVRNGGNGSTSQIGRVWYSDDSGGHQFEFVADDSWRQVRCRFTVIGTLRHISLMPSRAGDLHLGCVRFDDAQLLTDYVEFGSLISPIHDTGDPGAGIAKVSWTSIEPAGTEIRALVRSDNNSGAGERGEWELLESNPDWTVSTPPGRYLQYRIEFYTREPATSPVFTDIRIEYGTDIGFIEGTVTRSDNGDPVFSALVASGSRTARTAPDGRYVLPLEAGTHDVKVSMELFSPKMFPGISLSPDQTETLAVAISPSGRWPMFGGSMKRTRRTPVKADIPVPVIAWTYPLKLVNPSIEAIADLDGDGVGEILITAGERLYAYRGDGGILWESQGCYGDEIGNVIDIRDLDLDGSVDVICGNGVTEGSFGEDRLARLIILRGIDGSEQYVDSFFDSSRGHCGATGYGSANDLAFINTRLANLDDDPEMEIVAFPHFGYEFRVYDFSDGVEQGVVTYTGHHRLRSGDGMAVGDVDGDGVEEFVSSWVGDLIVYNAEDGSVQYEYVDFAPGNTRGATVIEDVDGDGVNEIVQISSWMDLSAYITVFDCDTEDIEILWQRGFERKLRFTFGAVTDVDGDLEQEIIVSDYGGRMYVLRAVDGSTEWCIEGRYPKSVKDMDNDGIPEILASSSVTTAGTPYIYDCDHDSYTEKCSFPGAEWVNGPYPLWCYPPSENYYCASMNPPNVDYLSEDVIMTEDGVLSAYDVTGSSPVERWSYALPARHNVRIAVGDVDGDDLDEVVTVVDDGTLRILDDGGGERISVELGFGSLYEPKVTDLNGDGTNEIIVQVWPASTDRPHYAAGDMAILDATEATPDDPPRKVGWGYDGPFNDCPRTQGYSPVIVDVDGDGLQELLVDRGISDFAVLEWDGSTRWSCSLENQFIGTGYFDADSVRDVFLTKYDHSRFYALDGTDGSLLWQEDKPTHGIPSVIDTNGDGIDDIVAIQEDNHVLAYDGSNGRTLWDNHETCALCHDGTIAIGDTDGDGIDELITTGNFGIANYDLNGNLIWQQRDINTDGFKLHFCSLVDVNGDGALDMVQPSNHGVYAFDGRDGTELWHFYPETRLAVTSTIAADIDGDDEEEILFGANNGYLYVLNKEDGSPVWDFYFGYQPGAPVVADTDMDGEGEILISCNGYLYCLDGISD